jgi:hypothetical protein
MLCTSEYIKKLDFAYAISYTGFRGDKVAESEAENDYKIWQLEMSLKKTFFKKRQINRKIDELVLKSIYNSRIIYPNGDLHESARVVHKFKKKSSDLGKIIELFNLEIQNQAIALCAPVYRDAIAFYSSSNAITSILHICFSCHRMVNEDGEFMKVNDDTFHKLKEQLLRVGHKIDE